MPTAARREKQRIARAKAQAVAADPTTTKVSVSTQTEINPYAIRDLIEKWWKWLDSHGIDQTEYELQFVIGMQSRSLAKSVEDLYEHEAPSARGGDERQSKLEKEHAAELAYMYEELYAAGFDYDPDYDDDYYDKDADAEYGAEKEAAGDGTDDKGEDSQDRQQRQARPSLLDGMD